VHWHGGGVLVESYVDFGAFFVATHDYLRRRSAEENLPGR